MMSIKLKALGLGIVAMLAMGAFGVMNAAADPEDPHRGGHFISETTNTTITGFEGAGTDHNLVFSVDHQNNGIDCTVSTYHGTTEAQTLEEVAVDPTYDQCFTTESTGTHTIPVHENGCEFNFTVNTDPTTTHNAVHVEGCTGATKGIVITHPNCRIVIPEQTVTGVTYTNKINPDTKKHEITMDVTATNITAHYHSGLCTFLGTTHEAQMDGSVTVRGYEDLAGAEGKQVDVTATGPKTTAAEKNE